MQAVLPSFELSRQRLANGLEVVVQADHRLPLVAINLWYHVGSKNERPGRTGLAHLFEHMLFQGSEHVGANDHFGYLQQVGGVANGSTWYDRTNYYETVPAAHVELGLWLESDRMGFLLPAMTPEKLENQREVVLNERRQRIDNQPYGRAFERLHELLYPPDHPYHWPVIGYTADIEAATLTDVEEFFRHHYTPSNAVLTFAGDIEPDRAFDLAARYFGEIVGTSSSTVEPAATSRRTDRIKETMEDRVELSRIYMGFRCPGFGARDWCIGDLLSATLSGAKSSPMYSDLVYSRQIAQDVSTAVLPMELESTFLAVATAKPGVDPKELESLLIGHLADLGAHGPSTESLERARRQVVTSYREGLQALDERADLISQYATYLDDPEQAWLGAQSYLDISADEIREFARTRLDAERGVTLTVVPGAK